jgi:hypothetical protein
LLFDGSQEDSVKISLHEERLQAFCEKIRQLQHEIMINQKVTMLLIKKKKKKKVTMLVPVVTIYSSIRDMGTLYLAHSWC